MTHSLIRRFFLLLAGLAFATMAVAAPDLSTILGQDENEFLHPDEAFVFRTEMVDTHTLRAQWVIADEYYLYRAQFRFELEGDDVTAELGDAAYPQGVIHTDEYFGEQEVYYQDATFHLPLVGEPGDTIRLSVRYQGCADAGLCYPPQFKTVALAVPDDNSGDIAVAVQEVQQAVANTTSGTSGVGEQSEQDQLADLIRVGNIAWVMLAFVGFGLLLTFTPCVLPMVPILSSIIVGQKDITTRQAFILSLVYVLAMALTYTVAGVLAGLFGANLQAAFQDPIVLSVFAAVFVLLSLSMFGFYDLQVPASWQTKLSQLSNSQQGGTLAGVAIMGFLSALIVGPCVAAPLAGALIVIGQTGDPVRGGLALFALSMGMGIPLLAVGTGFGKFVPKAGGWMNAVKGVFGVLLLAVAIYLLERIVPAWVAVGLWAILILVSAVYMGAFRVPQSGWQTLWKGIGLAGFVWALLLMVGLASGRADLFTPLKGFGGGSAAVEEEHLPFKTIKSVADLELEVAAASEMNKPVMLDFYADWCISCKEMERYTFSDPQVRQALGNYVLLQADVTANDEDDQALLKEFGLYGPPGIIFFSPDGAERRELRVVGFKAADEFAAIIERNN